MATINERSSFVEESGIFFERVGMTRMAGRIVGYLMVTDKEAVSFDELTQVLQASKSSISTNVRALLQTRLIRASAQPGDRKTYYSLSSDMNWGDYIHKRTHELEALKALFAKGLALRSNKRDASSGWLGEAIEFYDWLTAEFPRIIEKWEQRKGEKGE
jgi:DNA-binding transcriptional regulator GbsR (MarR family)